MMDCTCPALSSSSATMQQQSKQLQQQQQSSHAALHTTNTTTKTKTTMATLYQAMPAQVLEDNSGPPSSYETAATSTSSLTASSSSNDSDIVRVYDFKKQETFSMHAHEARLYIAKQQQLEEEQQQQQQAPEQLAIKSRPTDLPLYASAGAATSATPPTGTPTSPMKTARGATPTALKFLQPKRKLIELSEFMSNDELDEDTTPTSATEKAVIEKDVAEALPSVKVLALSFQQQTSQDETRDNWKSKLPLTPTLIPSPTYTATATTTVNGIPKAPTTPTPISNGHSHDDHHIIVQPVDMPLTDASKPSPPTATIEIVNATAIQTGNGKTSPVPMLPSGFLKNNIAFFEGLKSK